MKEVTPDKNNDDKEATVTDKVDATTSVEKDGDTSTAAVEKPATEKPAVESTAVETPALEESAIDESVDEAAAVPVDGDAPAVKKRSLFKLIGAALLSALLIASVALAIIFGWKLHNRSEVSTASRDAEATARSYAVVLTTTDSKNLDQNFKEVLDGATGEFKDMYQKSSGQLKQVLLDAQANGKGTVVESAVQSASKDHAVVLLFIDQTVSNKQTPEPRTDRSRVAMTLDKIDGRWLASKVDLP